MKRQIKKIRKSIEWGIYARESGGTYMGVPQVSQSKSFLNFNTHAHKNYFPSLSLSLSLTPTHAESLIL